MIPKEKNNKVDFGQPLKIDIGFDTNVWFVQFEVEKIMIKNLLWISVNEEEINGFAFMTSEYSYSKIY